MEEQNFGKWFVYAGLFLVLIGALIWIGTKLGIPFGRLPGDISVQKDNYSINFPIVTSIIISIVLTVLLNLIFRIFKN